MANIVKVITSDGTIRKATVEFVATKQVVGVKMRKPDGTLVHGRPAVPAYSSTLKFNYL